jgi:hypothetical protein
MQLIVPTVGAELGPTWAQDLNYNFQFLIDQHDHSIGHGVPVTPSGLNISSDLTMQGNSLLFLKANSFVSQGSLLTSLTSLYVSGGNLYYNDSLGHQIQITASGTVNVPPGIFPGLAPPASVFYNSATSSFIFQSDVNIAAVLDVGPIIVRDLIAGSFGITLQAPLLVTDYSLTLPFLPAIQSFMTLDAAGNMAAPWTVDNSTIKIISNQLVVQGSAIPNFQREHAWELNGSYGSLTYPLTNIDSIFIAPYDITIGEIWIYSTSPGSAGTTEFDLKVGSIPGTTWTSIFSTTGKIAATSAFQQITVGAITGTFSAGHTITDGTSGATGVIYSIAGSVLTVNTIVGTFGVGNTITDSTSLAHAPITAITSGYPIWTDNGTIIPALTGITKPVLATTPTTVLAGQAIRFDLIQAMTGGFDARIKIFYTQA